MGGWDGSREWWFRDPPPHLPSPGLRKAGVTQRGNRRLQTFFRDEDYEAYLWLVGQWCSRAGKVRGGRAPTAYRPEAGGSRKGKRPREITTPLGLW